MRFISPKTDFAFKKIFGSTESKDILISFLNALIYSGKSMIQDLEIMDPYSPGDAIGLKDTYLDVKALLNNGSNVIIEMQVLNVPAFEKRVVYNLCKTYGNQLDTGEGYRRLKPVIALTITDFKMFEKTDRYINHFVFKEKDKSFDYIDEAVAMIFVELPKFSKTLEELETITDKWIYFVKSAPSLEVIPTNLAEIEEIEKALNIANIANLSRKELEEVHKREVFPRLGLCCAGTEIETKAEGQVGLQCQADDLHRKANRHKGVPPSEPGHGEGASGPHCPFSRERTWRHSLTRSWRRE